jgi:hypothetical protein
MRILPRALAFVIAVVAMGASVRDVEACQCDLLNNTQNMTSEELNAWRFDKAKVVVSGRVVDVHAGLDTGPSGTRMVVGRLRVSSVLKGDAPLGDLTVFTGFGTGDCGFAGGLLMALPQNRDVTIELKTEVKSPSGYIVDICGFGKLSAGHEN